MAESCEQIFEPEFVKIVDGIQGAEGPVFCSKKVFYMVAPEVEKEGKPAGQIVKVDVDSGVVCSFLVLERRPDRLLCGRVSGDIK